jgi:hypothetical protein
VISIPVSASGIKLMIGAGWLPPDQGDNRHAVAKAVIRAANIGLDTALPRGERHGDEHLIDAWSPTSTSGVQPIC